MTHQRITIPRTSDKRIAEVFCEIAREFNAHKGGVNAIGNVQINDVDLAVEPAGEWAELLALDSYIISNLTLSGGTFYIQYFRGGQADGKSPIYDEVLLPTPNDQFQTSKRLRLASILNARLNPFEPARSPVGELPPEQRQAFAIHNATLERLERLSEETIRKGTEFRERLELDFTARVRAKDEEIATERARLEDDLAQKNTLLLERQAALDAKVGFYPVFTDG